MFSDKQPVCNKKKHTHTMNNVQIQQSLFITEVLDKKNWKGQAGELGNQCEQLSITLPARCTIIHWGLNKLVNLSNTVLAGNH